MSNLNIKCDNNVTVFDLVNCTMTFQALPQYTLKIDYGDSTVSTGNTFINKLYDPTQYNIGAYNKCHTVKLYQFK